VRVPFGTQFDESVPVLHQTRGPGIMIQTTPKTVRRNLNNTIKEISLSSEQYLRYPNRDFTRKRKLPFEAVLKLLVSMGGNTLCKELHDWFEYSQDTATASAFIQQREKILPSALEDLFHLFTEKSHCRKRYQGHRVLAVDGSDLRMPANADDPVSYFKNDTEDAKGYNLIHLDAMYDLLNTVYVDASLQPKRSSSEHRALVKMVERSNIRDKVILTADRGYESYNNMAHIAEKGWYFVIRAKESFGIITKMDLPPTTEFDIRTTITLTKRQTKRTRQLMHLNPSRYRWIPPHATFDYLNPKDDKMYDLQLRVVRFLLPCGKSETIYTNLPDEIFSCESIREIYRMRWGIETSFRDLKYTIGLANFHSKKPFFVMQEVFARLTFFNFCKMISSIVEQSISEKHHTNFSLVVMLSRCFLRGKLHEHILLEKISRLILPVRPERAFVRYQAHTYAVGFGYRVQ